METISKKQLGAETTFLKRIYRKFGKVNKEFQKILEERGYELHDLGTSKRCYTSSGEVGYKHVANSNVIFWGIGIYNRGVKSRKNDMSYSIYRAWIKRVEQ